MKRLDMAEVGVRAPGTLLIVAVSELTRHVRCGVLRSAGYHVIDAASAADALAAIRGHTPRVALLDVKLQDSAGADLCVTLKHMYPDIGVMLIEPTPSPAAAGARGGATAADGSVCEPIAPGALLKIVDDVMARAAPRASPAWVISDERGIILDASAEAARLLNGSRRGLQQRSLILFFDDDRAGWHSAVARACSGERVVRSGRLRPKERRPVTLSVEIVRSTGSQRPALHWALEVHP